MKTKKTPKKVIQELQDSRASLSNIVYKDFTLEDLNKLNDVACSLVAFVLDAKEVCSGRR